MKLEEFLLKNRISPPEFGVKVDMGPATIYRILRGKKPHFRAARKIETFTNGQVTVEELMYGDKK